MPAVIAVVESLDVHGRGLRVVIDQHVDQFGHTIVVVDPELGDRAVLTAVERDAAIRAGELSIPAFQALNRDGLRTGTEKVASLIGMADAQHWSLTIEPQTDGGRPQLVFDAACRVRTAPGALASKYRLAQGGWFSAHGGEIRAALSTAELSIRPLPIDELPILHALRTAGAELSIVRDPRLDDRFPATLRWRYAIEFSSAAAALHKTAPRQSPKR